MKVGIYDPYLSVLGGGERYVATIAEVLSRENNVDLFSGDKQIKKKISTQFSIGLKKVNILSDEIFQNKNLLNKIIFLRKYDLLFYTTDGSLFFSSAKENFLILQSPAHFPKSSFPNKLKMINWRILCYSQFIKSLIRDKLEVESTVLPPAIEDFRIPNIKKENIILTAGRFFLYPHNKKQDTLIDVFRSDYNKKFNGFKMAVAGGLTEQGGEEYLNELRKKAAGLPVEFHINPPYQKLAELYAKAKIYWHAAGFGEDLTLYPERAEHFGITTLEAMRAGCVPVVFAAGGQTEIVKNNSNGFLWKTQDDLTKNTYRLIKDEKMRMALSEKAIQTAKNYTRKKFYERLKKIIK